MYAYHMSSNKNKASNKCCPPIYTTHQIAALSRNLAIIEL